LGGPKEINEMRRVLTVILTLAWGVLSGAPAGADVSVKTVDFLDGTGLSVNAAGPMLVRVDEGRNRLIIANTLSSSMSVLDCAHGRLRNIPTGGRALQHLKSEAMTISERTGVVYLIGTKCFHIVSPESGTSETVPTGVQFESIAVDEATGNVFIAGRESKSLGFYKAKSKKLEMRRWTDVREDLVNLNATPPPPVRKVVADADLKQVIAVDGIEPAIYAFDGASGAQVSSRAIDLPAGGRWHLGGYSEEDHSLLIVVETAERKVVRAAKLSATGGEDTIVVLPELTEAVGIIYNPAREELYIPYDNHASVHVVDFKDGGSLDEIAVPAYGNDGSAVDVENDVLYVSSWAFGEIDQIDLKTRSLSKRITGLGIIPHMFSLAYNPNDGLLYFPKGATAVNGTFGAAVTAFDPRTESARKVYTGWCPVDLIELSGRGDFLVFNSEDELAEVDPDGGFKIRNLRYDYPIAACYGPGGDVYLSYGPHQSYWPTVYIWDAKDGILAIDGDDLDIYDRRIPRQALSLAADEDGVLYFTQNNWGKEEQFLGVFADEVRVFDPAKRITLGDEVNREITQRILRYDPGAGCLYLVRIGETDGDPSVLQVIDPAEAKVLERVALGLTSTDLIFDKDRIYVANFDSDTVSIIDKVTFASEDVKTGGEPLRLCRCGDMVYVITHAGNTIEEVRPGGSSFKVPYAGLPDNVFPWKDKAIITSHSAEGLAIVEFDPAAGSFTVLHRHAYPYGDTRFDSGNVSFYVRGQYGDALPFITRGRTDAEGRLWISDFLSGKLFILERS
jgi:YVTN family beta-propeller protein